MNLFKPASVPPSGGTAAEAMRSRTARVMIAIIAIMAFLALSVRLSFRTIDAQAAVPFSPPCVPTAPPTPCADVNVYPIAASVTGIDTNGLPATFSNGVGFNPDASVADTAGITAQILPPAGVSPLTIATTIDNTTHPEGPCGLIYWNPVTNAFKWFGRGGGFTAGIDLDKSAPPKIVPAPALGAPTMFQPGDVWVGINGFPPLYVNFKGTNNFRDYPVGPTFGVAVDQSSGNIFFTHDFSGIIGRLDPATNIVTTWFVGGVPHYLALDGTGKVYASVAGAAVAGGADAIVRIDPTITAPTATTPNVTAWAIPGGGLSPIAGGTSNGITIDLNGDVQFALSGAPVTAGPPPGAIGRLHPVTNIMDLYNKSAIHNAQLVASSGAGPATQSFFTEALGNSVSILTPAVSTAPAVTSPMVTPTKSPVTPSTSTVTPTDFLGHPRTATILPTHSVVQGMDPSGIVRFSPMPPPVQPGAGGNPDPSGMTQVAGPGTIFGSYLSEFAGNNSAVFQLSSTGITAPPPGDAAITATGVTFSATEGQPFAAQTVANFHDPDPMSTAAEYSATIDWGDGSSTSTGTITLTSTTSSGNNFAVTGSHTYTEEGTYTVKVTITDVDNSSNTATATSTAHVADAALTSLCAAAPVSTQSFSGPTATFTDGNSFAAKADFSASINWGDSTTSAGTVSGGPGVGPYTVSGNHTYSTTGTFTITTTIKDDGGATTTATCHVIVFAFPTATGAFVIGDLADPRPIVSDSVTWWSSQWTQLNPMSGGPAPASMKGFAGFEDNPLGTPRTCGSSWTTDTGNATPPPPSVPAFMGVLVSSMITQNGSVITGNIKQVVVVRTNPGYAPDPGHTGTGTIVAIVCAIP